MSSDDNLYRAPRSSLQATGQDGDLTPAAQNWPVVILVLRLCG